jgi:hypothetical protein
MSSNNYMYIIGKPNEDFRIFIENLKWKQLNVTV